MIEEGLRPDMAEVEAVEEIGRISAVTRSGEHETTHEFAFFSGGQWTQEKRVQRDWTETRTLRDGSERRESCWQVDGFSKSPAEEFGSEYSIRVVVYRAEGAGKRGFLVELEMGGTFDYVICPQLSDLLALMRDALPLVRAARDHMQQSIADEHYSVKHWLNVQSGYGDEDCMICQHLMEGRTFAKEL